MLLYVFQTHYRNDSRANKTVFIFKKAAGSNTCEMEYCIKRGILINEAIRGDNQQ